MKRSIHSHPSSILDSPFEALSPSTKLPDALYPGLGRTVSAAPASLFPPFVSRVRSAAGASVSGVRITSVASITARGCLPFDMHTLYTLHASRNITSRHARLISPGQAEPNHGNPKVRWPLRPNAKVPHLAHLAPALRSEPDPI
jgi:hypothetical protein